METVSLTNSYSILLVDDEVFSRDLLKKKLSVLLDVTVTGCSNGMAAKNYLLEHIVDLVITDVRMPVMDGLELTRFIHDFCPETLVVIVSGYGEFEYAQQAIQYGVQGYLLKPLQTHQLMEMIEQCQQSIQSRRLAQLSRRYHPHEELEMALQQLLRSRNLEQLTDVLSISATCRGTVVKVKPTDAQQARTDLLGSKYRNLIGGILHHQAALYLGLFKGEYYYLIMAETDAICQPLSCVPEYLNRILAQRIGWNEYAQVHSAQELKALAAFTSVQSHHTIIEHACEYMQKHLAEPISRTQVAEYVYLSPSHFGSLFKQVKGIGYNVYLTNLRIEEAKRLLEQNISINDVASAVGYRDSKYFSEVFAEKTGVLPSDYKTQQQNSRLLQDKQL